MSKFHGKLAQLKFQITPLSGSYTEAAYVKDIGGPESDRDAVDMTTRDSPSFAKEFIAGWIDGGEAKWDLALDPASASTHQSLMTLHNNGDLTGFALNFTTLSAGAGGTAALFNGFVKSVSPAAPMEDHLACSITTKVSGPVTWAGVPK